MWKIISANLPDVNIWIQAVVVILVPYLITKAYAWIRTFEDE